MNTKNDNVQELQNIKEETTKSNKTTSTTVKKKPSAKKKTTTTSDTAKEKKTSSMSTKKVPKEKETFDSKEKMATTSSNQKAKASRATTKKKIQEKDEQNKQAEQKTNAKGNTTEASKNDVSVQETLVETPVVVEDVKRFKLFFVSDMDEEATYLHEMSLQGYHFINKKGMQYFFCQGESKNYYYHLGYHEKDKHDGTRYLDNYAEAGWENIYHEKAEFDGIWNYFRIEMPLGEPEPNIFSDRTSRLALYKRLLSSWRSLLALVTICFVCMLFVYVFLTNHPGKLTGTVMTLCAILIIFIVITFIIYLRAYLKISKKQNELQNM